MGRDLVAVIPYIVRYINGLSVALCGVWAKLEYVGDADNTARSDTRNNQIALFVKQSEK